MNTAPLLSVVIPTRLRNAQLAECLRTLATQDLPREQWEVVVVFDGDDARPDAAINALAAQLPLTVMLQPRAGCGLARNRGVEGARGRYVIFTDDDCRLPADWLSRYARAVERHPDCLLAGRSINALHQNPYSQTTQDVVSYWQERANRAPGRAPVAVGNNFAVPAASFRQLGGFGELYRMSTAEDRDFSRRWMLSGRRIVDVPEVVVLHAHQLGFRSFLRQHFGYGRGAYLCHREPHSRAGKQVQGAGFYLSLLLWPVAPGRGPRMARLWPLVIASQCAQAAGYLAEWLHRG